MLTLITTTNEKQGNGKYRPLRTRKVAKKSNDSASDFDYLANNDLTMRFNKAQDPIYFAFDCLEQRSVPQLMGDFVEDSFFAITNFVSKVIKK